MDCMVLGSKGFEETLKVSLMTDKFGVHPLEQCPLLEELLRGRVEDVRRKNHDPFYHFLHVPGMSC